MSSARASLRLIEPNDDLVALTELLHVAYRGLAEQGLRFWASHQDVSKTLERISGNDCFLAFMGRELVGTITVNHGRCLSGCTWYARPEVAKVNQLAVLPHWRNLGIGSQLLNRAESQAADRGAVEVALDTAEPATELIAWYISRGYRLVDRVQWDGVNYRSVVLSKTLSALPAVR